MAQAVAQRPGQTGSANRERRPRRRDLEERDPGLGRRVLSVLARVLIPVVLVAALGLGIGYVRLLNGPISLKMLADALARSLSDELAAHDVSIEDAIVRLAPEGTLEFRLKNVRLFDNDRQALAIAPLAAVSLSSSALWSGRIAPERVVLIEPRMLVLLGGGAAAPADRQGAGEGAAQLAAGEGTGRIDLARVLAQANAQTRKSRDGASYLKAIGVRQATFILDHSGRQSVWRVPEANIDLEHKKRRSVIEATALIYSKKGPWRLSVRTEDADKTRSLSVKIYVDDMMPSAIAEAVGDAAFLRGVDVPLSGELEAELDTEGVIEKLSAQFDVGRGRVVLDEETGGGFSVEAGKLALGYDRAHGQIQIMPSRLANGDSHIVIAGQVTPVPAAAGVPSSTWAFRIAGQDGVVAAADLGVATVKLETVVLAGRVDVSNGQFELSEGRVRGGGADVVIKGAAAGDATAPARFEIGFGAVPLDTFKALWPPAVAPEARAWVGKHVIRARVTQGMIRLEADRGPAGKASKGPRVSIAVEVSDGAVVPVETLPAIEAQRVLVRLEGRQLEIAVPEGSIGQGGRRVGLRAGRFAVADIAVEHPVGEASFRVQGPLSGTLAILDREPIALARQLGGSLDGVEGKVDGQIRITIPLERNVQARDVGFDGKVKVTEARGKGLIGGLDVTGAALNIDLGEEAIDIKGDMLVQGVATKLAAQHILRAPPDKQPPIRLNALLDAADRSQLGLDLSHIVAGETPVEVTVSRGAKGELMPRVRADLTAAELMFEPLAWSKPPGRAATLQLDLAKGTKYKTELQNVRLVGDDIAVEGWMGLDGANRLKEFVFPDFSINVVTRLEMRGEIKSDIWDIRIKGQTFDGRDFFRSLFSVGRLTERQPAARSGKPAVGVDVRVEFDTVLGHSEVSLKGLKLTASKRGERLTALVARATLDGGAALDLGVQQAANEARRLVALSDDAGQVFKLVGFYPNMQGGRMRLSVNLDGKGPAEKTGLLEVASFRILGDPVVAEVLYSRDDTSSQAPKQRVVRQAVDFDSMRAPFAVGHGQFVIDDAELRGALFGGSLRGKADFRAQMINLAGTYSPLQGLNAAVAVIPMLGQLLTGPRGEGVLAVTFAVQGPMARPQVLINPLSLFTPGFLREITQISNPSTQVVPRAEAPAARPGAAAQSASQPVRPGARGQPPSVAPEVSSDGWSSTTAPGKGPTRAKPPTQ